MIFFLSSEVAAFFQSNADAVLSHPMLLMFPASNKTSHSYQGEASVSEITAFVTAKASHSFSIPDEASLREREQQQQQSDAHPKPDSSSSLDPEAVAAAHVIGALHTRTEL